MSAIHEEKNVNLLLLATGRPEISEEEHGEIYDELYLRIREELT